MQEYPWQNQHNYADGKTKHEPVSKINDGAFRVVPEEGQESSQHVSLVDRLTKSNNILILIKLHTSV